MGQEDRVAALGRDRGAHEAAERLVGARCAIEQLESARSARDSDAQERNRGEAPDTGDG